MSVRRENLKTVHLQLLEGRPDPEPGTLTGEDAELALQEVDRLLITAKVELDRLVVALPPEDQEDARRYADRLRSLSTDFTSATFTVELF